MLQIPGFLRLFPGDLLWTVKTSSKVIYLTFDDGPVPEVTPRILEILDQYGWKATFFQVGENIAKYPELQKKIVNSGHQIGNHSFNHLKGFETQTDAYVENVKRASEYIPGNLFRPPYGRITFKQIRALRRLYRIVMWDVITYDYDKNISPENILKTLRKHLRKGSIVVFHDSLKAEKNVLEALPLAIEYWKSQGYTWGLL